MTNYFRQSAIEGARDVSAISIANANEARKRDAYNALSKVYGPIAGNPEAALQLQAYDTGQQTQPYKVESARLGVEGQRLQNQSAEFNVEHQPEVFRTEQGLKGAQTNALNATTGLTGEKTTDARTLRELNAGVGMLGSINEIYDNGGTPADAVAAFDRMAPNIATFGGVTPDHIGQIRQVIAQGGPAAKQLLTALQQQLQARNLGGLALSPAGMAVAANTYLNTGQIPALGQGKAAAAARASVINEAAKVAAQNGMKPEEVAQNFQFYKARGTYLNDLAKSGPGTAGGLVRSAGAVLAHMDILDSYIGALGNHNLRAANAAAQLFKQQTGKTAPTNFDAQKTIVTDELTRYLIARGGGVSDREEMKKQVDKASSPAQLRGVINTWKNDIVGQLDAQRQQALGFKAEGQFDRQLTPQVRQLLGQHNAAAAGGGNAAGAATQFQAGVVYTDAQGNKATFKGGDPNDPASWEASQ